MASTVRSLSNHYDILRVPRAASGDEIVEAFAAEMRAARLRPDIPVARLAELSVAYETLRDPAKRRAYDSSLGPDRAPKPVVPSAAVPAEARVAAFIASSLRDPVKPERTEAAPDPVPQPPSPPVAEPAPPAAFEAAPARADGLLIDRNRATIGAGVAGLVILALAVSLPDKNPDRIAPSSAPVQAVTIGLPPAAPVQDYVVPPEATLTSADEGTPAAAPKAEAQLAPAAASEKVEEAPASPPSVEVATVKKPSDPLAPLSQPAGTATLEPAPAAATTARLPLPNATIARTIERIGYACGSVASASAVDGAEGVFKVNCSSGDSYRAAPVGGRYHFRRWDRG
jgi:curved DNA-binding protein CbpA